MLTRDLFAVADLVTNGDVQLAKEKREKVVKCLVAFTKSLHAARAQLLTPMTRTLLAGHTHTHTHSRRIPRVAI